MPLWLLKLLPYGIAAAALIGAVWYIDHKGYERAENEAVARETERKFEREVFARLLQIKVGDLENVMQEAVIKTDTELKEYVDGIRLTNKTVIQPTLIKEIRSEARFTDPTVGITDGMLREVNRARGLSRVNPCTTAPDGTVTCPLSPPRPAD